MFLLGKGVSYEFQEEAIMPLGSNNLTTLSDGSGDVFSSVRPSLLDASDYADFLAYVNSFNWSGVAEVVDASFDDSLANFLGTASAPGLDLASFWLNFSEFPSTATPGSINDTLSSSADVGSTSVTNGGSIWEAGKLRIPLYRYY